VTVREGETKEEIDEHRLHLLALDLRAERLERRRVPLREQSLRLLLFETELLGDVLEKGRLGFGHLFILMAQPREDGEKGLLLPARHSLLDLDVKHLSFPLPPSSVAQAAS
jgi:hypothetical protein